MALLSRYYCLACPDLLFNEWRFNTYTKEKAHIKLV